MAIQERGRARFRRAGLGARIIAWFLIPTAVILAAVGVLAFTAAQRATEELALARTQDRTLLLANQLSAALTAFRQPLGQHALGPQPLTPQAQQAALEAAWPVGTLAAFDAGVLVLDRDGTVTAAVPARYDLIGASLPELLPAGGAPANEDLGFSGLLLDRVAGLDVMALSRAIEDMPGQVLGAVVGLFRVGPTATRTSELYRAIWELYIGRREVAYLVDSQGRIVFHPDAFLMGTAVADRLPVERALAGQTGAMRTQDLDGREVVAGYTPVPRTSWALITEDSWADVQSTSLPYLRFIVALLALGVVIPILTVTFGVRRMMQPLGRLTQAAGRIAAGDFSQDIEVRSGDELEVLAGQFNTMAAELRASYATLEQRVADRTQELATLNAVAAVVSRSLALDEIMEAALAQTMEALQIEAGAAFQLENETLHLVAHRGLSGAFAAEVRTLPLDLSAAGQAVAAAEPVVRAVDEYPDSILKGLLREEGLATVISVPLAAKGQMLGALDLVTHQARVLTGEERSLLAAIGQQVGLAVVNARLYEEAEASAAAEERNRLARDLHDAVSQTLFTASLIADVVPQLWEHDPNEARRQLEMLRRLTRGAQAEMRTLLMELRPAALLEANFGELIGQLGRAATGRAEIDLALDVSEIPELPPDVKVALYRIAQEALNNVVKHSGAARVTVSLFVMDGAVELHICDNGRGFEMTGVPAGHFGLSTMRERAEGIGAMMELRSAPGAGTCVSAVWRVDTTQEAVE